MPTKNLSKPKPAKAIPEGATNADVHREWSRCFASAKRFLKTPEMQRRGARAEKLLAQLEEIDGRIGIDFPLDG